MPTTLKEFVDEALALIAKHPEAADAYLCQMNSAYGERELSEWEPDLHLHTTCFADGTNVEPPGELVVLVDGDPGPPDHPDEDYCDDFCELKVDCVCDKEEEDENG